MNGLFFEDVRAGETVQRLWETKVLEDLQVRCSDIRQVSLCLPNAEDVQDALADNLPLLGEISFALASGWQRSFAIPLPYHGVFLASSRAVANSRSTRLIWNSWLEGGDANDCKTDLTRRICLSFPVWLRKRVAKAFDHFFIDKGSAAVVDLADDRKWTWLAESLVPIERWSRREGTAFERVDPDNVIELAGRLTGVRRLRCSREALAHVPAEWRENHPSFAGRLCPIETPESELVGLQLQLARGAWVDLDGRIQPAETAAGDECTPRVSWGTGLVPFFHHNDDGRTMMGAKNIRQAMRVAGAETPCVTSGGEAELLAAMAPLVEAGVCPDSGSVSTGMTLGCDLLVAYLPWYGWNVDDAVVVSADVCARMAVTETKSEVVPIADGWRIAQPFATIGTVLTRGSVIAAFTRDEVRHVEGRRQVERKCFRIVYADEQPGELTALEFPETRPPQCTVNLRYTVTRRFPLEPGDKLMGRHGNKGVVARVLSRDEMPRLPDGTPVDILLNPHGVLSRLNPGQLLETHLGWLFRHGRTLADVGTADDTRAVGVPCTGRIDFEKVQAQLLETGLDERGCTVLSWTKSGRQVTTAGPVVVGYQHFFRLHHIPAEKAQARRGGLRSQYSLTTGQAAHGRSRCGGQRLGEMETWALAAYPGTDAILAELLGRGDAVAQKEKLESPAIGQTGYGQVFADMLAGMLVKTSFDHDGVTLSRLADEELDGFRFGEVVSEQVSERQSARFVCPHHPERTAFGQRFAWTGAARKSLSVATLLAARGWRVAGPLARSDAPKVFELPVEKAGVVMKLQVEALWKCETSEVSRLAFAIRERDCGTPFFDGLLPVRCCSSKCKNGCEEFLLKLCETEGAFGELSVLCPCADCEKKAANELIKLRADDVCSETAEGGICDSTIFGSVRDAFVPRDAERWGYIKLPEAIAYPAAEVFGHRGKLSRRQVELWQAQPKFSRLPVLPLRYRMPVEGVEDPFGYVCVLKACGRLASAIANQSDDLAKARKNLVGCVAAVFNRIADRLCGKKGLVRHEGLGRRVDRSCRLVLAPNPELELDEAGVPASILWELLGDQIEADEGSEVREHAVGWEFQSAGGVPSVKCADRFRRLRKFLKARDIPLRVLVNRQPSLHKYSMQSFRIRVMKPEEGMVLQLPPLCFKGFAADCDGDEVTGYLPLSASAQAALERLSPAQNLISEGSGEPVGNDDRDMRTGAVLLCAGRREQAVDRFRELSESGQFSALADWSRRAYAACTEAGVSFGFFDLIALGRASEGEEIEQVLRGRIDDVNASNGERSIARLVLWDANGAKQIGRTVDELVAGQAWSGIFDSAKVARSAFCDKKLVTGKAGDLTRRLVFALRSRPGGLIAAQTIGERGTQLAMKQAHGGEHRVNIDEVRRLILRLECPDGTQVTSYAQFKDVLLQASAYRQVSECHLQLLWNVLSGDGKGPLRGLDAVLGELDASGDFEALAHAMNRTLLARMLTEGLGPLPVTTPAARVMFNNFGEA